MKYGTKVFFFSPEDYLKRAAHLLLGKKKKESVRAKNKIAPRTFSCQHFAPYHLCVSDNLRELLRYLLH